MQLPNHLEGQLHIERGGFLVHLTKQKLIFKEQI